MKKGIRLLIAGLLGIAVTGASTLAYFTSTATVAANGGEAPLALKITNGTVEITAAVGNGTDTPTWSYDVARISTSPATYAIYGVTDDTAPVGVDALDTGYVANYVDENRSMDITGFDVVDVDGNGRYNVGAELTDVGGIITNARPGDAIVLGDAGVSEGINITNTSTLTVKVRILVETDAAAIAKISSLASAGWVMYVNGVATSITTPAELQTELDKVAATLVADDSASIKIRLELPLLTDDDYQNKAVSDDGVTPDSFDVSSLFTIMATQENNPGWNNAGN